MVVRIFRRNFMTFETFKSIKSDKINYDFKNFNFLKILYNFKSSFADHPYNLLESLWLIQGRSKIRKDPGTK